MHLNTCLSRGVSSSLRQMTGECPAAWPTPISLTVMTPWLSCPHLSLSGHHSPWVFVNPLALFCFLDQSCHTFPESPSPPLFTLGISLFNLHHCGSVLLLCDPPGQCITHHQPVSLCPVLCRVPPPASVLLAPYVVQLRSHPVIPRLGSVLSTRMFPLFA